MEKARIEILLIEDDLAEADLIREMLAESRTHAFSVEHVQYLADGIALLKDRTFDCVLVDLGLPDSQGLETALTVRDQAKLTPVAIITMLDDEELALKALQMDIQDYLIKGDIAGTLLVRSIRYAIQRKRVALALQESEQRFTSFMRNLPAAAWMKDMQGRYVYANTETERIFSTPLAALLGKTDRDLFPPETARQFGENDCRVLSEGTTLQTTEVLRQPDGIEHYSIVNKFPVLGSGGQAAYVAGVAFDITDRVRAEEALRESEEKFSRFFDTAPVGITISTLADGRFVEINKEGERLSGFRRDEVIGRSAMEFYIWKDPAERARMIEDVLKEGAVHDREMTFRTKEGNVLHGLFSAVVIDIGEKKHLLSIVSDITERKRIEAELEHFASFPRLNPIPIMELDSDGKVIFCNRAAENIFGKTCFDSSNPLIPKDLPDMLHDLRQNKPRQFTRTVEMDGRFFDELVHLVPEFDVVRIYAIDVTERRRLEEERGRLAAIVESSDDAIIAKTLDGIIVDWNTGAEKLYGYTASEIKGRHISALVPADLVDEVTQFLEEIGRGKTVKHIETIRVTKDGRLIPVLLTVSPIKDASGRIIGASTITYDITDRKQAEKALKESEMRFRALVTASSEAIYRMSPDWSEMRQLFSKEFLTSTEGSSRTWLEKYIHPDDQPHVNAAIQEAIRTKSIFELEHRVQKADGSLGWTFSRAVPLMDANGEIVEWFGAASDITERKRADEEIERLNTDLTARAVELEEVNRELEAFNYTVAHDLRKPLTTTNGYCQAIRELCGDKLDAQCAGYLREAYEGTLRMNRLIEALLNFSRVTRIELRRETVDLSRMAREVADELRAADPGRRVTFRIVDGIAVDGDANLLRVALDNLLGNAWKYTGAHEEAIIEFGTAEVDGRPACFVRDNGPGFDMADAEKLFLPFQRLPSAEEFKGFGIGLATVERIVRRHGGRIWAEGEPGKGATFWFSL